jgi:hypothetical protein
VTKLECGQIFAMLSEYLDHELPPNLCDEIEQHIEGCAPCVEFVKSLEKTISLCREVDFIEARPVLSEAKLAELKAAFDQMT